MKKIEETLESFAEYLAEYHGKNGLGFVCTSRMINEFLGLNQSVSQPEEEPMTFSDANSLNMLQDNIKDYEDVKKQFENNTEEWSNYIDNLFGTGHNGIWQVGAGEIMQLKKFIEQLLSERRNALDEYLVNGGDPECTIISTKDYQKSLEERSFSKEELGRIKQSLGFTNAYALANCTEEEKAQRISDLEKVNRLLSLEK